MKKILALALVVMLSVAVFAGCGGAALAASSAAPDASSAAPAASSEAAKPAADGKAVTIKWMVTGNTVKDDKAVMEKVNAILNEKINVNLEMLWAGWGDFDEKALMAINGGDAIDIYFTSYWTANEYTAMAKKGAFVRLDDPANDLLTQYAPKYFDGMPSAMKDGMVVEGSAGKGIYGVPAAKELAMQYVWEMNKPVMDKYGITADQVTNYFEFGPLLEKVKAGEGADFYPLSNDTTMLPRVTDPSIFVDSDQLLTFQFDPVHPANSPIEIKSRYETEGFKKFAEKTREYYEKGYINPAAAIEQTMAPTWTDSKTSGKWLLSSRVAAPGYNIAETAQYKYQIDVKNAVAGVIETGGPRGAMHAISVTSKNPDKAMQVLDIVNSDVAVHNLLGLGAEGVHYNLENGKVKFTPEKDNFMVWKAGIGQLAMYTPTVDDPDDIKGIIEKFNTEGVETLPILGWSFNPDPVKNELAALANVRKEFYYSLSAGSVDPATELPKFIEKLKANGIDKVVEEGNNQLKAFMAAK